MTKEKIDITETHLNSDELGNEVKRMVDCGHAVEVKIETEDQLQWLNIQVHPLVVVKTNNIRKPNYYEIRNRIQ